MGEFKHVRSPRDGGILDGPTRRAIAAFQIDRGQPATGDLDDVTAKELAAPKP